MPNTTTWKNVLARAGNKCEWKEGGYICGLSQGEIDPVGGGTVRLTPDHMRPHSIDPNSDPNDPDQWQALCGRHQVVKKNYWDSSTGKLNTEAVLQSLPREEKEKALRLLLEYFSMKAVPVSKTTS